MGELHTRPQQSWQAKEEVFLGVAQVFGPHGGGNNGLPHHGPCSAAQTVELVRTQLAAALDARAYAYADGGGTRADTSAGRAHAYVTERRTVRWSRCEWGR